MGLVCARAETSLAVGTACSYCKCELIDRRFFGDTELRDHKNLKLDKINLILAAWLQGQYKLVQILFSNLRPALAVNFSKLTTHVSGPLWLEHVGLPAKESL